MKKIIEIYRIQNGYLVKKEEDEEVYMSYQVHASNDQRVQMMHDILKALKEKGFRMVSEDEAAKIHLSVRPDDRPSQT